MIDQLERRLAEAERRAGDAAARAAAAEAAASEKEGMISWVGEEVERVKALFDQKVSGWLLPARGGCMVHAVLPCCALHLICPQLDGCPTSAPFPCWLPCSQEARLTADRDAAQTAAAELRGERDALAAVVQQAEAQAASLGRQLQEEQVGWWLGLHGCANLWG